MTRITNYQLIRKPEQPVLSIRKKVSVEELPSAISRNILKISGYLNEIKESMVDIPSVVFHDYKYMDEDNIDLEIICPVMKKLPEKDEIKYTLLPEGDAIFSFYSGIPDNLSSFYEEMENWINKQGYNVCGDAYECYYNDEQYGLDNLLTKITLPVSTKS